MTNEYFSNFNITNFSSNGKFTKFLLGDFGTKMLFDSSRFSRYWGNLRMHKICGLTKHQINQNNYHFYSCTVCVINILAKNLRQLYKVSNLSKKGYICIVFAIIHFPAKQSYLLAAQMQLSTIYYLLAIYHVLL